MGVIYGEFTAGPIPVLGAHCDFASVPEGLEFEHCNAENGCEVWANSPLAGRYLVTCTAADGRIKGSMPVTVE